MRHNDSSGADSVKRIDERPGTSPTPSPRHLRVSALAALAGVAATAWVAACSPTVTRHGHHFSDTDLQQVQPGMSQEQVRMALGSPATSATVGSGQAFYYIASTQKQAAFFAAEETDRQVVAVYFTPTGTVERVANYGMKDGKVFDTIRRTTPAANKNDEGFLQQIFRNLGKRGAIFGE
jgi:outer membrane protein assembly factor BamE (lipoprotein component of BamABCDE complex)